MAMIAGCSSLQPIPDELDRTAYACIQHYQPQGDPLYRSSGELAPESSFLTIDNPLDALQWRQALANKAEHTLDIQYFIWRADDTGALLIQHVLEAADRGVRVRLLMDDLDSINWNRRAMALDSHPWIEIRVFNPFKMLRGGWGQRVFELALDLKRLNHRMHNKLFMADQSVAIVGGRNIGDEYFGSGSPLDYRDYDLIAIGPVVEEITQSFETFWDSAWAYPVGHFSSGGSRQNLAELRKELNDQINESEKLASDYLGDPGEWSKRIYHARSRISRGIARAVFDCPASYDDRQFPIQTAYTLRRVARQANNEILVISPYVVPLKQLREAFRGKIAQGVDITIYTNSLASSDHTLAFSGYSKHRPGLLRMGVSLRELKPDAPISTRHRVSASHSDYLSMHAKLAIFDRRWVYVGSLNLDARSAHWNTELGLLVDSPELAANILDDFSEDLSDDNSWHVESRTSAVNDNSERHRERLYWISHGAETYREPSRGLGQSIANWFYSLLPLDEQL